METAVLPLNTNNSNGGATSMMSAGSAPSTTTTTTVTTSVAGVEAAEVTEMPLASSSSSQTLCGNGVVSGDVGNTTTSTNITTTTTTTPSAAPPTVTTTTNSSASSAPLRDTRPSAVHRRNSHSGLSALLSAVTLQLSESSSEDRSQSHSFGASSSISNSSHHNIRQRSQTSADENDHSQSSATAGPGGRHGHANPTLATTGSRSNSFHDSPSTDSTTPTSIPERHESHDQQLLQQHQQQQARQSSRNHHHHQQVDQHPNSFPHILMGLLMDADNHNMITFLPDGKYFCFGIEAFRDTLMEKHFEIDRWESFLETLCQWGFQSIQTNVNDVEVFRHPLFRKGDWKRCNQITAPALSRRNSSRRNSSRRGSSGVSSMCLDDRPRSGGSGGADNTISSQSSHSNNPTSYESSIKRRLSPAHAEKVTAGTSKVRIHSIPTEVHHHHPHHIHPIRTNSGLSHHDRSVSGGSASTASGPVGGGSMTTTATLSNDASTSPTGTRPGSSSSSNSIGTTTTASSTRRQRRMSFEDCRSLAVNITTEKLQLASDKSKQRETPLVSQAVFGATHTIVSDAIETLLRDEDHTRETFQKHANELSKSSLPGLVPISKQLFSQQEEEVPQEQQGEDNRQQEQQWGNPKMAAQRLVQPQRTHGSSLSVASSSPSLSPKLPPQKSESVVSSCASASSSPSPPP